MGRATAQQKPKEAAMSKKTPLKINFMIDPNAKPLTPDKFCRALVGTSEAAFIRELQIGGNNYLDSLIEKLKNNNAKFSPAASGEA